MYSFLEQGDLTDENFRILFNIIQKSDEYKRVDWADLLLKKDWDECCSIQIEENAINRGTLLKENLIEQLSKRGGVIDIFSLVEETEQWVVFIHNVLGKHKILRVFLKN